LAGAALGALDARVRAEAPFAGVWRQRLALAAAAASVRIHRRGEDEEMLRDAFYLRYGENDDPGPAGRVLVAWRALDPSTIRHSTIAQRRSVIFDTDTVGYVASLLDLKMDDGLRAAIESAQQIALDPASYRGAPFAAAAETVRLVCRRRPDAEVLALWLADAVLAIRLKWPLPLPLIASALLHPSLRIRDNGSISRFDDEGGRRRRPYPGDPNWVNSCTLAYWRAAAHACDLFAELERKARKLAAVAPRLRAKGATAVIERLYNEDAVLPSAMARRRLRPSKSAGGAGSITDVNNAGGGIKGERGMSKRGMRRLFDRLVALGAVRELTGRTAFRLYGL
jgi:hypothetical protein